MISLFNFFFIKSPKTRDIMLVFFTIHLESGEWHGIYRLNSIKRINRNIAVLWR